MAQHKHTGIRAVGQDGVESRAPRKSTAEANGEASLSCRGTHSMARRSELQATRLHLVTAKTRPLWSCRKHGKEAIGRRLCKACMKEARLTMNKIATAAPPTDGMSRPAIFRYRLVGLAAWKRNDEWAVKIADRVRTLIVT